MSSDDESTKGKESENKNDEKTSSDVEAGRGEQQDDTYEEIDVEALKTTATNQAARAPESTGPLESHHHKWELTAIIIGLAITIVVFALTIATYVELK